MTTHFFHCFFADRFSHLGVTVSVATVAWRSSCTFFTDAHTHAVRKHKQVICPSALCLCARAKVHQLSASSEHLISLTRFCFIPRHDQRTCTLCSCEQWCFSFLFKKELTLVSFLQSWTKQKGSPVNSPSWWKIFLKPQARTHPPPSYGLLLVMK
jgi:hypothetical protein